MSGKWVDCDERRCEAWSHFTYHRCGEGRCARWVEVEPDAPGADRGADDPALSASEEE